MDVLKFRWGRRGARDLMQYAPSGKIADTLNTDDEFFSEVMRSHRHFSAWRLMSLGTKVASRMSGGFTTARHPLKPCRLP